MTVHTNVCVIGLGSMGMGAAVTFVMALAALVAWLIQTYVLVPLDIVYMQTIVLSLIHISEPTRRS